MPRNNVAGLAADDSTEKLNNISVEELYDQLSAFLFKQYKKQLQNDDYEI